MSIETDALTYSTQIHKTMTRSQQFSEDIQPVKDQMKGICDLYGLKNGIVLILSEGTVFTTIDVEAFHDPTFELYNPDNQK